MSSQPECRGRRSGGFAGPLRDPIVPLDFGGWFRRVYGVFRTNLAQLGTLALVPLALAGLYLILIKAVTPTPADIQQQLMAKAAASPTGTVSQSAQLWVAFGPTLPVMAVFLVLIVAAGAFYQSCANYLVLRKANGQPTSISNALSQTKGRVLPIVGWGIVAGLVLLIGLAIPLLLSSLFLPDSLTFLGSVVAAVVSICLGVVLCSSFSGVVIVERAGLPRCFRLVKPRFWATLGRMVVAWLIYGGYLLLLPLVAWLGAVVPGGVGAVITGVVELALLVPAMVYLVAVSVVSYAELRFREDPATTTRALVAEMTRAR